MDFGVVVPSHGPWGDAGMIRAGIQAAEDLGYGTAWFGDHLVMPGYAAALDPGQLGSARIELTNRYPAGQTCRVELPKLLEGHAGCIQHAVWRDVGAGIVHLIEELFRAGGNVESPAGTRRFCL